MYVADPPCRVTVARNGISGTPLCGTSSGDMPVFGPVSRGRCVLY
jgi:hypothetical protein